ncbi:MAG: hypothetical protein ACFFD2_01175, partial [Promethearchaeota archaeon]
PQILSPPSPAPRTPPQILSPPSPAPQVPPQVFPKPTIRLPPSTQTKAKKHPTLKDLPRSEEDILLKKLLEIKDMLSKEKQ